MTTRILTPRHEPLMALIVEGRNLREAWRRVRANDGAPGADSVRIADFERQLPEELADLQTRLLAGTYVPEPLRRTQMPKRNGGTRDLAIPTVRDRVAQRAFVNVLEPILDPVFLPCSFGYRPGLSVSNAVERVLSYRAAGCDFALDADIADFFGSLSHETLLAALRTHIRDEAVLRMIALWLEAGLIDGDTTDTQPLLETVGAHLQGAAKAFLNFGDDLPESDFADTDTAQALWSVGHGVSSARKRRVSSGKKVIWFSIAQRTTPFICTR